MNSTLELLGQPCRNFQIMASTSVVDPKDGIEKIVLSNFVAGGTGNLVLIHPQTGEGESLPLPGDEGGEDVFNLDDEKLLVGTSETFGYLQSLDLRTRAWATPLKDKDNNYIWHLCRGSDGLIYGGTYPGCHLVRYDPKRHTLENLGRVSDDPANLYSRFVYGGIPGHILVACGMNSNHLSLWNITDRTWRRFGKPGAKVREITPGFVCTETNGVLDCYDPRTFQPLDTALSARLPPIEPPPVGAAHSLTRLKDGSVFGLRGQEYIHIREQGETPVLKPIPTPRPATNIFELTSDTRGVLWGASNFGQTIFSFDPARRQEWNSQVVCDVAGEVYGMQFARGKLFLSAYCGGDHVVYDPARPWSQVDNVNPQTLQSAGPALIRPEARSVIGPDGHFWTGWLARYGTYGGGLSRVNVDTLEVTTWYDPVPKQGIGSLAVGNRYLFFATCGDGNGLPTAPGPFHFVVWDLAGKIVRDVPLAPGETPGRMVALGDRVLLAVASARCELRIFNPGTLEFEGSIAVNLWPQRMIACGPDRAIVFVRGQALALNLTTKQLIPIAEIPGNVTAATRTSQGEVYFATGLNLYRLMAQPRDTA